MAERCPAPRPPATSSSPSPTPRAAPTPTSREQRRRRSRPPECARSPTTWRRPSAGSRLPARSLAPRHPSRWRSCSSASRSTSSTEGLVPQYGFDADLQPMLDGLDGVPVTIAGVTAKCSVRDSDQGVAAGAPSLLIGRAILLRAKSGTFPGAVQGAAATVDYPTAGTSYKVVSARRDGPTGQF